MGESPKLTNDIYKVYIACGLLAASLNCMLVLLLSFVPHIVVHVTLYSVHV